MTTKNPEEAAVREAGQLGIEAGMMMAGAMVHLDLLSHLGPVFSAMQTSPMFEAFSKSFVDTLVKASKGGPEGLRVRSDMAYLLRQVHGDMCKRAASFAVDSRGNGGEKVIMKLQHMMESAKCCGRAADALYHPIERNLNALVESGRQMMAFQEMKKQHDAVQHAEAIAHHDCGDPDCPVHAKN